MNKHFPLSNKQAEVEDAQRLRSGLKIALRALAFGVGYFAFRSPGLKRNVHSQYQIDILARDPENRQKNLYFVRHRGIELADELVALEDYRGGSVVSAVVPYRGYAFHMASGSRVIVGQ